MPIRYRHYHIRKIAEFVEKQNETVNGNKDIEENKKLPNKVQLPDFVTKIKAPKK